MLSILFYATASVRPLVIIPSMLVSVLMGHIHTIKTNSAFTLSTNDCSTIETEKPADLSFIFEKSFFDQEI
jgi:hypothetical protein